MVNLITIRSLLMNNATPIYKGGVQWYLIDPRNFVHPEDLDLNPQTCVWRERYTVTAIRYNDDGQVFSINVNIADGIYDSNPGSYIYVGTWEEIHDPECRFGRDWI